MVITVTVDNAKSNDVVLDYLKKKLEMKDGCMLGCRFLHMRFVAHILNLIVQRGLKGIHNSIVKVRTTVLWNSTYLMLEAAEKFEIAFDRMHEEDVEFSSYFLEVDGNGKQKHIGPPKGEDWVNVLNYQVLVAMGNVGSSIESSASFPNDLWKIASHEFDEHIATEDDNECTIDVDKYLNDASEKIGRVLIFWLGGR
ncbi:hypothetical protein SO802_019566 [Lithocarpus litseifolius]|uniref:Transposase n=1 Tax=Lithocarpus litseifolius TaxID=425828 RepID=A0AAW2CR50_9ROSI